MRWTLWRNRAYLERRARRAAEEAKRSQQLLDRDRKEVIWPMAQAQHRDRFGDLIRLALLPSAGNPGLRRRPAPPASPERPADDP